MLENSFLLFNNIQVSGRLVEFLLTHKMIPTEIMKKDLPKLSWIFNRCVLLHGHEVVRGWDKSSGFTSTRAIGTLKSLLFLSCMYIVRQSVGTFSTDTL